MNKQINIYKSIGDGLRANPELEDIEISEICVGNSLAYSDNQLKAKRLAKSEALDFLLLDAYLKGVNFFTERDSKTTIQKIGSNYVIFVCEYGRGHIGNFKNYEQEIENRKKQLEIAEEILKSLDEYDEQTKKSYFDFITQEKAKLR
jgi:hypothetical protein